MRKGICLQVGPDPTQVERPLRLRTVSVPRLRKTLAVKYVAEPSQAVATLHQTTISRLPRQRTRGKC